MPQSRALLARRIDALGASSYLRDGTLALSPLPAFQGSQRNVIRQVEMDRRDRNVVLLDGLQVRAGDVMPRKRIAADPVILSPAGIAFFHDRLAVDALALAGDSHALDLLLRNAGEGYVEERVLRKPLAEYLARHLAGEFRGRREPEMVARRQGCGH